MSPCDARTKLIRGFGWGIAWFLLCASPVLAQVSVPGYTRPITPKPQHPSIAERVRRGEAPLSRLQPEVKIDAAPVHRLPALNPLAMRQERKSGRLRIGAIRRFDHPIDGVKEATRFQISEGELYVTRIVSTGASSVRLHFANVNLPTGASLFAYSRRNPDDLSGPYMDEAKGGLSPQREIWTPPMEGDEFVVEYFVPAGVVNNQAPFAIDRVSHIFLNQRNTVEQVDPGACNQEVPGEWVEASKSVGLFTFTDTKGEFACSGVLVNNTKNDGTPYFLTAHHCLSRGNRFLSPPTVYWNYNGGSTLPPPESRSVGAQLLDTGPASDFSLLRLSYVPQGVRFAGWTTQKPDAATNVVSVHHPQASYKRFSNGQTVNECADELPGGDCNNYLKVRWQGGITEPGSSGAPLFAGSSGDPRVVGLLYGGTSSCNNRNGTDYFGRFDLTFNAIAYYLAGQGCATVLWPTEEFFGFPPPFKTYHVFSAAGGAGSVKLKVIDGDVCSWGAASNADWITITSATNGSLDRAGEATISYTVAPYSGTLPRTGLILIAGKSLLVTQGGAANCNASPIGVGQSITGALSSSDCRSAIDPTAFADRHTFTAQAGQQIAVSLSSDELDPFLMIYASDGTLLGFNDDFEYQSNARVPDVISHPLTLPTNGVYTIEATSFFSEETGSYRLQIDRFCFYSLTASPPTPATLFPADGSAGTLNIAGPPDCSWTATTNVPWIMFNSATNGVGNGTLSFTVAPNPTIADNNGVGPREGLILVGNTRYVVKQSPICGFRVTPTNLSVKPEDVYYGTPFGKDIQVGTGFGCPFAVKSNAPWIQFPERGSEYSATGPQTVSFKFTSIKLGNEPRIGTISIAGQPVTITQEPIGTLCSVAALNVGQTISDSLVTNCRSILGYSGAVKHYRFRGRAGQKIALVLSSAEASLRAWVLPINADESLHLNWRLEAQEFFLTNVRAPQNGFATLPSDGDYLIEVASNNSLNSEASRYVLTLTEASTGNCEFSTAPLRNNFTANAANGSLNINAQSGSACIWVATSTAPWITITSGLGGNGSGVVNYSVAANPGAFRAGTIVAAGRHLVITQQPGNAPAVVSSADYSPDLTSGQIVAMFGTGLANQIAAAQSLPLPTTLAGTTVTFKDLYGQTKDAPLFFVSPNQINLLIPYGTPPGPVTITVKLNDNTVATTAAQIALRSPRLFTADTSGRGVPAGYLLRVRSDGSHSEEAIFDRDGAGNIVPRPIRLPDNESVYLVLYGTGFAAQSPSQLLNVQFGDIQQEGLVFATPGFAGLDQINVLLPWALRGKGDVIVTLTMSDASPTNPVTIRIADQ